MGTVQIVAAATLIVVGFTACAEFGSYAFVHPVIRRLPLEHHVAVEQGLVRTFGRVMPVAMPVSMGLLVAWSVVEAGPWPLELAALGLWLSGLVTTVIVNVAINARTARWEADPEDPAAWRSMRTRWEMFQAFRSWAFLASFLVLCVAAVGLG